MPRARTVRPPVPCGPCGGGSTGSSGRRGSACAGGSRAPCDGDGCSAGTYACSRLYLRRFRGMSTPLRGQCGRNCMIRPAPPTHAAAWWRIVDVRHPSTWSDRPTVRGGGRGGQTHEPPPRPPLWMTSCRGPREVVTFRGPRSPRNRGLPRDDSLLCPGSQGLPQASDLHEQGRDHRCQQLVAPDRSGRDGQFTACGQLCGHSPPDARCEAQDNARPMHDPCTTQ